MARVTYGESVTELAGSIGGVTFQRNTSGPVAKLRTMFPVNPSDAQQAYQLNLSYVISKWQALAQSYKNQWNAIAAAHNHTTPYGATKVLSGYQWYVSCYLNLLSTGQSTNLLISVWYDMEAVPAFTLLANSSDLYLHWNPAYHPQFSYVQIFCSGPIRQSTIKLRRSMFKITLEMMPITTDYSIKSAFESYFNVTWASFYANSQCNIIAQVRCVAEDYGWASPFTGALCKIG